MAISIIIKNSPPFVDSSFRFYLLLRLLLADFECRGISRRQTFNRLVHLLIEM